MDVCKKMFEITERIFSNWTALKLIVESSMGTKDDARALTEYIAEILSMNEDLIVSDLTYEMEDYISSKFRTEIDDGSYEQVAEELVRFHSYVIKNEEETFQREIAKLSPLQSWLTVTQVQSYVKVDSSSDESEEEKNNESMEVDEWVTVKSKRKNNK